MGSGFSRRRFFTGIARAIEKRATEKVCKVAGAIAPEPPVAAIKPAPYFRPPGALEERAFLDTCKRCTDCLEACPYDAIRRLGSEFGEAGGTPAIIVNETPCYLCEDTPCILVCEPKALIPTERSEVRMGLAVLNLAECFQAMGQPCDYCVIRCPLRSDAICFDADDLPRIDDAGCAGCGVCAYLCPNDAIQVVLVS